MFTRNLFALSLAAALVAAAPVASAESHDYRDNRDYGHDMRGDHRDHREFERERIARERRYEYARHHDYRYYEHAPRGYAVAAPVFVSPPVVYSAPPAPSGINIVVPISFP